MVLSLSLGYSATIEPSKPIKGENGMVLTEFAKEPLLKNTVGVCVDDKGRVYATSVVRRKAADLDIRQFRKWITDDLSLRSVEDKAAFYKREIVDNRHKRIGDQNKDGVIDWKDLMVLSDRIIRLEDRDGDGVADEAITYADGFNTEVSGIAAGVTAWDGKIYATVEPDAWVLEDKDNDGVSDIRTSLGHGYSVHIAYAGHNFSGPVIGPDGRVYFSVADKGLSITNREGELLENPHSGAITRCELDGSNLEIFATGLRNVQEPAFDQYGNLFGVDNDGDMKGEKERFLYIVEGSDTGWRCYWQYRGKDYQPWLAEGLYVPEHPKQSAHIVPCLSTYRDGPTGFAFNPGTALNDHYKDHFFMTAFPARKLHAFKVAQKGPAFEMTDEHLVASGVLMTGINFGPDGALYIADWSAKGYELNDKGGVWKMDDPTAVSSPLRVKTAQLLAAEWKGRKADQLVGLLGHADQRIRMKAQFELARQKSLAALESVAIDGAQPLLARLHAIWGLGQIYRRAETVEQEALVSLLKDSDAEVRAQTAKVISEIPGLRSAASSSLMALLSDPDDRPRFFAAIALGRLGGVHAMEELLAYLERDGEHPYHRHAGMMGLAGSIPPEQLTWLVGSESQAVRLASVVALRRLKSPFVTSFLKSNDPLVVAEAARAIHDDDSIPSALPALAELLAAGGIQEEATVRRALSAAMRLREPKFAGLVADYATEGDQPEALRLQALTQLQQWSQPEPLDSVEGCYRELAEVSAESIRPAIESALMVLMADASKPIAESARKTAAKYGIGTDPKELLAIIRADDENAADALRLLAAQDRDAYALASEQALKSKHAMVRAAALDAIASISPDRLPSIASQALKSGELVEQRAALALLGGSDLPEAATLLKQALDGVASGVIDSALALDVVEAAGASKNAEVKSAVARYEAAKDSADPLSPFLETMHGGDLVAGKDLFENHVAAQCIRCHMVEDGGSDVGPPLGEIGKRDARFLLESLIAPGAEVAPGFGITAVTLKSGETVTATLASEETSQITLAMPDGKEQVISRSDIESFTPPVSSMPPMGFMLNKREIRDLLAYLQTLK